MKSTLRRVKPEEIPPLPPRIAAGHYTSKDVDAWMRSFGLKPLDRKTRARLKKAGLLGMPKE